MKIKQSEDAVFEYISYLTMDVVNLKDKKWLLTAIESHTHHNFPSYTREHINKLVKEWFEYN